MVNRGRGGRFGGPPGRFPMPMGVMRPLPFDMQLAADKFERIVDYDEATLTQVEIIWTITVFTQFEVHGLIVFETPSDWTSNRANTACIIASTVFPLIEVPSRGCRKTEVLGFY